MGLKLLSSSVISAMLLSLPACTGGGGSSVAMNFAKHESGHNGFSVDVDSLLAEPDYYSEMDPDPRGKGFRAKILYSSKRAKATKPYNSIYRCNYGPLHILSSHISKPVPVEIDDCGATDWFDGKKNYILSILNTTRHPLGIDSIEVPDDKFEINLRSSWFSGITFIDMVCDTGITYPDYRLIVHFLDHMYAPQVLHVNLHPDGNILRAKKINASDKTT